jgi:hypothetical protein
MSHGGTLSAAKLFNSPPTVDRPRPKSTTTTKPSNTTVTTVTGPGRPGG